MKTPAPDRKLIVKELEERLKKKWAAQKNEQPAPASLKKATLPVGKKLKHPDHQLPESLAGATPL